MSLERLTGARRAWTLLPVLAAFSALAAYAPAARALVVVDRAVHKTFSIVPAIGQTGGMRSPGASGTARFQGASCTTDCLPLSYHNGAVEHGETIYLIFWAPSSYSPAFPASYETGLGTWVNDLVAANGTSGNPISVNTQYYDLSGPGGSKSYVPYAITNGGTRLDTNSYPPSGCPAGTTCLTDAQVKTELSSYIQAHSLPTGLNIEYFVMTPQGVHSCFDAAGSSCSYSNFCAYHSSMSAGGNAVTYSDMPWSYGVSGCDVNSAFGAGYPNSNFIDPVVGVFSHELSETMTDPVVGQGWVDGSGNEIGDKCAYTYGSHGYGSMTGMNNNGSGYWNVKVGSDLYLLQQEFDNQIGNCVSRMTETWSGTTPPGATAGHWSTASNWGASIAPGAGSSLNDSVETLLFPELGSAGCTARPPTTTCYTSNNDLTSLSAYGLSIDGGSGYSISGNGLTLGAGGITSTTAMASSSRSSFSPPITLGANQTWSIDGGAHKVGALALGGAVGGSSKSLQINLANSGSLALGADAEIGAVNIVGTDGSNIGALAPLNGNVSVANALNGSDGNTVSLTDAALLAPATSAVGGLTSTGGDLEVGRATMPAGALTVQGGVTLDSGGRLKLFIDHAGTTAGTDNSQLVAHGNVTLGGSLVLSGGATCPALSLGDKYTLISASGSISGAFFGVPNGQDVQLGCAGTPLQLQVDYTANSVTATVVTLSQPSNSSFPTISGTAREGQLLTLSQGQWTNSPTSISDQWQVCDSSGSNCSAIAGATSSSYRPNAGDVGHTVRVQESAANTAGQSGPVASGQTSAVAAAAGGGGGGSGGNGSGTVSPGPASVSGSALVVPLSCSGGTGAKCAVTLTLTVTETTMGSKVIAVVAGPRRRHTKAKRVLVVGTVTVNLTAGQRQVLRVVLNAAGQHLLGLRHVLTVKLAVVQAGRTVSSSNVTFRIHGKPDGKHPHKR